MEVPKFVVILLLLASLWVTTYSAINMNIAQKLVLDNPHMEQQCGFSLREAQLAGRMSLVTLVAGLALTLGTGWMLVPDAAKAKAKNIFG